MSPKDFRTAMEYQYTATIYLENEELAQKTGNDVEELYIWMLTYENSYGCGTHGEIIDSQTQAIVKTFKKSPIE